MNSWWFWMIFAAAFVVGEIFTAGFFLLWAGIGAALAGVASMLGFGPAWQWAVFVVVSGILLVISRRFSDRISGKQPDGIGADRFRHGTGIVIEEIDADRNTGRVRVDGEEWLARSSEGVVIPEGSRVKLKEIEGVHVSVTVIEGKE